MAVLDDLRIVDLSPTIPGQAGCSLLADLGADVIHISQPGLATRRGFQRPRTLGRSTRSIVLDLRDKRGLDIFYQLVQLADVIVEGFRPGVTGRLGVDYQSVAKVKPEIVYVSLSGFGQTGPYAQRAGHDLNFQGMGGLLPSDAEGRPVMPSMVWADRQASMNLAMAITVGLLAQKRDGVGQYIETSYLDGTIGIPAGQMGLDARVQSTQSGGLVGNARPLGELLLGAYPCYNIYECSDGSYLTLCVVFPWFWKRMCEYLEKPEWVEVQHPSDAAAEEMFLFFRTVFKSKTREEWLQVLGAIDIPSAPVLSPTEVMEQEFLAERGSIVEVTSGGSTYHQVGIPYRFARTPASVKRPVTVEGADTLDVLRELGFAPSAIDGLAQAGVVGISELINDLTASNQ